MKKIFFSLFLLSLLSTTSCNNDDDNGPTNPIDQLPPETQTGENTFGFLLNGEPINVTNTNEQVAIYQGGGLQFGAGGVYIVVLEPFTTNTNYNFMNLGEGNSRARFTLETSDDVFCLYEYNDTYQGSVIFTNIDQTNFIVSGTFEFSTINDDCENINITNGRFDLQYIP